MIMEQIKQKHNKWCLNDIVNNLIKSKSAIVYINKVQNKTKYDNDYYVDEEHAIEIIRSGRSKECKDFIKNYDKNIHNGEHKDGVVMEHNNNAVMKAKNMIDIGKNIFMMGGHALTVVYDVDKNIKTIWIKGIEVAEILEYSNLEKTLSDHVSNENKKKYSDLLFRPPILGGLKGIQKNTIFININGLFELLMHSKKNEAKQFQKWITNEVIPSLYNHGSYSIQQEKLQYKSIYDDIKISDYDNKKVVYIAYVGNYNNEEIFKYGISSEIFKRDYEQHRKSFDIFTMIYLKDTDNNEEIETLFEQNMKIKKLHRKLTINTKNQTELFTTTTVNTIDNAMKIMDELIDTKKLPAIVDANNKIVLLEQNNEIKKLELQVELKKEETKQLEIALKRDEEKRKILELEIKKLEITKKQEKKNTENDIYQEYINKHIVTAHRNGIKWTILQTHFSNWYSKTYKKTPPNSKDIKQAFIDKLFKCKDTSIRINGEIIRGWCGYKFNDV
jgi:prophage antirepressor-like protein